MIPGIGGMNPKKMQAMMKQLGINQDDIEGVSRVVIEKEGGNIVIEPAQVTKINMQGNESWQIVGEAREEDAGISEEDVKLVAEKTGKSEDEAREILEEVNGDIAEAIVRLS
jgi:nascent polypeptide-associated complex subunit alpha